MGISQSAGSPDIVAHGFQSFPHGFRNSPLSGYDVRLDKTYAGGSQSFLKIQSEIDEIHDHLGNGLADGVSARSAEGHPRPPLSEDNRRTIP